jgi:hypothetical protein
MATAASSREKKSTSGRQTGKDTPPVSAASAELADETAVGTDDFYPNEASTHGAKQ